MDLNRHFSKENTQITNKYIKNAQHSYLLWVLSEVTQLCPTLCDPMDCSLPGSSIHGILQARVLEWVAISFSRGSSRPRDRTQVSRIVGRRFSVSATREVPSLLIRETQINITMRYHFIPNRTITIERTIITSVSTDAEKLEFSCLGGRIVKWCSIFGKQFCRSLT